MNVFGALVSAVPALAESDALKGDAGTLLTGLFVGGMAGFWHSYLDRASSQAKAASPVTHERT